ncbi:6-carboxy-5,6,7,8-tetrahydropterin synthase [Polystyrenella longa]|uniref:6-carboxy-5,6,7,8-tetrahydropterin synthase n=1 Tax=Polystyrenella longa TaxID=2528007 RepID=A0A518CMT5_9PLAN|nr:6-pyruvoyl tetrahydropterin synthase family protein [Polystyrenella longa]QDU80546.1 6-carboxy-5,6,7,8-tetrahydropterin synthase [Polystyrenella longa]
MSDSYRVRVTKDHLVFSAAHFITFNGNICERLHGHNWRVAVEVSGNLDENSYVYDFIALRDGLQEIVNELDHRVLLPTLHPTISVEQNDNEVIARFEEKRWVFPTEDCLLLDIANTTAELLASWIASELVDRLHIRTETGIHTLQIEVEENFGQWAIYEKRLENSM